MERQKKKYLKRYIWLMFGILFSFAVGMIKTSGSLNLESFFNQGEVYEFAPETFTKSSSSWHYDPVSAAYVIVNDNAKKSLPSIKVYKSWNYIGLNVSGLNRESTEMRFSLYDNLGNKIWQQSNVIQNGDNLIPIQYPEKFCRIKMIVKNQSGLTITVNSMQLKDTDIGFSTGMFLKSFASAMAIYLLLTLLITVLLDISPKKRNWYAPVEILQYIYILSGNYLGEKWTKGLDKKTKSRIRKELFWFLFTNAMIYQALDLYMDKNYYKYGILLSTVAVVVIAVFSWEKPLQYVKWNGILPISWLVLWTAVCISDFVVSKYFNFTGYAFLFGVGFFFFVWNNMEKPKQIRNDMIRGLEWTFPVVVIYCMLFRQKIEGIFYNGAYCNRQDMALYTLMMLIAFLSEIFYYMLYSRSKSREKWITLYTVGTALSIYFLWKTQVRICLTAGVLVLIVFFCMLQKEKKPYKKSIFVIASVCSILAVLMVHISVTTLPKILDTNLIYENDRYDTVYEELQTEGLDENVLKNTSSVTEIHKKAIWKNYLRKMNLFGNEDQLIVYGKKTMAYNGLIEMAYRYGILILIPYIGLLLLCFYYAVHEGGFLMLATTLAYGTVMLTQNIEQPFAHPLWIVFYLGMGIWFAENGTKQNRSRIEKRIFRLIKKEV